MHSHAQSRNRRVQLLLRDKKKAAAGRIRGRAGGSAEKTKSAEQRPQAEKRPQAEERPEAAKQAEKLVVEPQKRPPEAEQQQASGKRRKRSEDEDDDPLKQLIGLDEDEKRQMLLSLLSQDCRDEGDCEDPDWVCPEVDDEGRTATAGEALDFGFRACEVQIGAEALPQLLKACRLVFPIGGSSWLPCGAKPRCLPERLAAEVFAAHTAGASFDRARSGAEWWAQVREGGHSEEAVQFHWDTDEVAVERHGLNIHPHLSTVTYLTDCGAPTLVVDRRKGLHPDDVAASYGPIRQGMLSRPRVGKHVVFDGQLLHGTVPKPGGEEGMRITFLVNMWLDHRPSNCHRMARSMAKRLGDAAVDVSVTASAKPASVPVDGKQAGCIRWDTIFGRRNPEHQLVVSLPPQPPSGEGATDGTVIVEWSNGTAEFSKCPGC